MEYGLVYKAEDYANVGSHRFKKEDAAEMLLIIKEVFDRHGIVFMPAYGTLLGIIRQNDFIPGDHDMDLIFYDKDREKFKATFRELEEHGVVMVRCVEPLIYTFQYKTAECDIEGMVTPTGGYKRFFCILEEKYVPKRFFEETEKVTFLGTEFDVPKDPEKLLVYHYGKNWRIPQSVAARMESPWLIHRTIARFYRRCIRYITRHWLKK